jgi:hypothetical protein
MQTIPMPVREDIYIKYIEYCNKFKVPIGEVMNRALDEFVSKYVESTGKSDKPYKIKDVIGVEVEFTLNNFKKLNKEVRKRNMTVKEYVEWLLK